jgi:hypothetical protein
MIYISMPSPLPDNELHRDALVGPPVPPRQGEFQSLFELTARRLGMDRQFQAIRICHSADLILKKLLPDSTEQFRVAHYRGGILTIQANNPALLQKIHICSHLLLEQLQALPEGKQLRRIRTKIA